MRSRPIDCVVQSRHSTQAYDTDWSAICVSRRNPVHLHCCYTGKPVPIWASNNTHYALIALECYCEIAAYRLCRAIPPFNTSIRYGLECHLWSRRNPVHLHCCYTGKPVPIWASNNTHTYALIALECYCEIAAYRLCRAIPPLNTSIRYGLDCHLCE